MAILNIGSLNWDHAFKVSHLPAKGETVAAKSANLSLGGKGQNGAIKQPRTRSDLMRVLISLTAPPHILIKYFISFILILKLNPYPQRYPQRNIRSKQS